MTSYKPSSSIFFVLVIGLITRTTDGRGERITLKRGTDNLRASSLAMRSNGMVEIGAQIVRASWHIIFNALFR